MSISEAEAMGGRLVLVASQAARTEALIGRKIWSLTSKHFQTILAGEDWDPLQVEGLTGTQWAILERVGRARYHGEVTQGRLSLQAMNVDPKTLFYHRKPLVKVNTLFRLVNSSEYCLPIAPKYLMHLLDQNYQIMQDACAAAGMGSAAAGRPYWPVINCPF